jgi:hypothetical protein
LRPSGSAWLASPTSTIAREDASRRPVGMGAWLRAQVMASMLIGHLPALWLPGPRLVGA